MARAAPLLLALCLAFAAMDAARAQDLGGLLSGVGDTISDPEKMKKMDSCNTFMESGYRKYEDACTEAGARSEWQGGCPDECRTFWAGLSQDCKDSIDYFGEAFGMKDEAGNPRKPSEWFNSVCGDGGEATTTGAPDAAPASGPEPALAPGPDSA